MIYTDTAKSGMFRISSSAVLLALMLTSCSSADNGVASVTEGTTAATTTSSVTTAEVPAPADVDPDVPVKWVDFRSDDMSWDSTIEHTSDAFPGTTFRWSSEKVEAVTDEGTTVLYEGMPVWNVYLCDLTGDGKPELCSTVSFGSGIVDEHIIVYDYADMVKYELWDRGNHDYSLGIKDGVLTAEKRVYNTSEVILSGKLELWGGKLTFSGDSDAPAADDPAQISLTSTDLHDGYWDVRISHDKGEDISPHLSWDSVEGAACYAVYMIDPDGGNWVHMKAVTTEAGLEAGDIPTKKTGTDGEDMGRYIGPYPPNGVHTYNVYVFALKDVVGYKELLGGSVDSTGRVSDADGLMELLTDKGMTVLSHGELSGKYPGE